jgi:hypothetical protein
MPPPQLQEAGPSPTPRQQLPEVPAAASASTGSPAEGTAAAHRGTPVPTRRKATDVPAGQMCRWRFVKYHASEFERLWAANISVVQTQVCKAVATPPFDVYHNEYLAMLDRCAANAVSKPGTYTKNCDVKTHEAQEDLPDRTFSKFEYALVCGTVENPSDLADIPFTDAMPRKYSYIEPLAGLLRHPQTCTKPQPVASAPMFNKGYLLVDSWAAHRDDAFVAEGVSSSMRGAGQVRSWYFDLGASTWSEGLGGASQEWFYSTYRNICIDFDRFLMWEVTPERSRKVFSKVPGPLRPRYHWFNIPAGITPGDWSNPLTYIEAEATEDDFVMLKIDIDTPKIELPLVQQIAASPKLASLVDEFYFEHHVNVEIMGPQWNIKESYPTRQDASIEIFTKLRRMGVRAHSWI